MTHCAIYAVTATLEHILPSCSRALADGIYTWKHNQVLENLATGLDKAHRKCSVSDGKGTYLISFVRGRGKARKVRKASEDSGRRHPDNKQ